MKKPLSIFIILLLFFILTGCTKNAASQNSGNDLNGENQISTNEQSVDKIEVYYFHRTQRCISCLTIGEYINKTMIEYFSDEMADGKIDYKEINVDLTENKDLARKFQASGSALFINAIRGEDEDIENVLEVWSLKSNEDKFKSFLKQKIDKLL